MIDLGFAFALALICLGAGKRILDHLGEAPEHPLDAAALALPLGFGLLALGILAIGELGCLSRVSLAIWLAVLVEIGLAPTLAALRALRGLARCAWRPFLRCAPGRFLAVCAGSALLGTALVAMGPVTDGDALCYHLQVPKLFLMRSAVGFDPDLHETVYPLVTELIYSLALEFRGPVACRGIQWVLGLVFTANVIALGRPCLGGRAWWAGCLVLLAPAVSNGMSAPLNDVALAAFGTAAVFAWTRLLERPSLKAAVVAGLVAGLAIGVKYPALVLFGMLAAATALRSFGRPASGELRAESAQTPKRPAWLALAAVYVAAALLAGGWWYLRAWYHTGNPVYPFFRHAFGGAGLDEVLEAIKRPLPVTPWNLLTALAPMTLGPDRFDSFSHQFGPIFLLFLPVVLAERPPRRVLGLVALGYGFLMLCLTQRQSMRFVLLALGPLAIAVAHGASVWCERKTFPARAMLSVLAVALGLEAGLCLVRCRQVLGVVLGRESAETMLARREPTFVVGRWAAMNVPATARLIGQDHRGFYIPRPYTMELAHRRRTGLGSRGESAGQIVACLRESGFTHVLFCPPVPENAAEFDPALGRLLAPWLRARAPIYRADLADGDGVLRCYAIYDLSDEQVVSRAEGTL
jgi:hypothetical protein